MSPTPSRQPTWTPLSCTANGGTVRGKTASMQRSSGSRNPFTHFAVMFRHIYMHKTVFCKLHSTAWFGPGSQETGFSHQSRRRAGRGQSTHHTGRILRPYPRPTCRRGHYLVLRWLLRWWGFRWWWWWRRWGLLLWWRRLWDGGLLTTGAQAFRTIHFRFPIWFHSF